MSFLEAGAIPFTIKAENVVIMDDNIIQAGAVLSPFSTITSNVKIGSYFHANIYSYVGHDCVIGDYVTFAPSVKCNGNIVIEDYVYIGTGAVLKQGRSGYPLTIGRGAVVGIGAVVTKDVPPGVTVIDVKANAGISVDNNPAQLSDMYAKNSRFRVRIAHSLYPLRFFSALFGARLPGPGCVYVSQNFFFKKTSLSWRYRYC